MTYKQSEFEGKDLAEALAVASEMLGLSADSLHYEILEPGRKGLFGIGAKSVRLRVLEPLDPIDRPSMSRTPPGSPTPARRARPTRPERRPARSDAPEERRPRRAPRDEVSHGKPATEEAVRQVVETMRKMIELGGFDLEVRGESDEHGMRLELAGTDLAMGGRDEDLAQTFQFLLGRMARRCWPDAGRIRIQADELTGRRDNEVVELARTTAEQVSRTGKSRALAPMNSYERRLVHMTISEIEGVISRSVGDGALKRVKIAPRRSGGPDRGTERRAD